MKKLILLVVMFLFGAIGHAQVTGCGGTTSSPTPCIDLRTGAAPANPAANRGRIFMNSTGNVFSCKLSTGASCASNFATTTLSGMTAGSVIFAGTAGLLSQNNANFFWKNSAPVGLGIGNAAPGALLDLGLAGTLKGVIRFAGETSGNAAIQVAAVAQTPNPLQLPIVTGTSGQVLQTDGANPQQLSWVTPSSGTISAGTTGTLPKYTGSTTIGDSIVSDDTSTVTIAGALTVTDNIESTGGGLTVDGDIESTGGGLTVDGDIESVSGSLTIADGADITGGLSVDGISIFGSLAQTVIADQEVTTATLTDSTTFVVALDASTSYFFRYIIFTLNDGAAEGLKLALTGTVGVGSLKAQVSIYDDTLNTLVAFARVTALDSSVGAGVSAGAGYSVVEGSITTTTAGQLRLQFAQNAAGANAGVHLEVNSSGILNKTN